MLSKAKIARCSAVPITTVKTYMEHFEEFFTPQTEPGGKRIGYAEAAIDIIRRIRELSNQQKTRDEIRELLRQEFDVVWTMAPQSSASDRPPVASISSAENRRPDLTPSLEAALEAVMALNQMNDELGKTISKQKKRLIERGQALRRLYAVYEQQARHLKSLEKRQETAGS